MLFNSYGFMFVFFPIVLVGFYLFARQNRPLAALWLACASLYFYGWWNPKYVVLLGTSVLFNFAIGYHIGRVRSKMGRSAKLYLLCGISGNLVLLGYYKYTNFLLATINLAAGTDWNIPGIVLPLGISFFTFTQIAFLVDVYSGLASDYKPIHYLLFVTFFPHLIAGPVLHHKQMMPQFDCTRTYRFNLENINVGLTIFTLGLFKKVVLADRFALDANPIFDAAANGAELMFLQAWIGALAYSLQIYFDFSGYSDMAIGLARMFNVKLPLNFDSPYKALSIIDFWRRWHMTLSAFLRDYLYFPLGGNRKGPMRRYGNLLITMLLGGLWHGAGWNFVIWGGLHGVYLIINHTWRGLFPRNDRRLGAIGRVACVLLTFSSVVVAWVSFRAGSLSAASHMLAGMAGQNDSISWQGIVRGLHELIGGHATVGADLSRSTRAIAWLLSGLAIVWLLPNTQEWLSLYKPAWDDVKIRSGALWRPTTATGILVGVLFGVALLSLNHASEFLYFQF